MKRLDAEHIADGFRTDGKGFEVTGRDRDGML